MKKIIAVICALMLVVSCTACGSSKAPASGETVYSVGVCQLVQFEALDEATRGFVQALNDLLGDKVSISVQNASGDSATCSVIINQFVSDEVDLIMANATAALQAAASATNTVPILGTSISHYGTALNIKDWNGSTGTNISGTSDLAPLDGQAEMLHDIFPDAKTVGILFCSGEPNSVYQCETITPFLEAFGYTVKTFTFADTNDVSAVTANACSECDVIYIPTDNTAASCTEAINNVALNAQVPIVAGEQGLCKGCGTVTLSISYFDIGYKTGEMAYEVLVNGADISTMEIEFAPQFTKQYNADICAALNITVPDDYIAIG